MPFTAANRRGNACAVVATARHRLVGAWIVGTPHGEKAQDLRVRRKARARRHQPFDGLLTLSESHVHARDLQWLLTRDVDGFSQVKLRNCLPRLIEK